MDNNAVVIADPQGVIRFWSPGAQTAFGHSSAEAVGQPLDLIVPPEFRADHWKGFRRAVASGAASVENQVSPFPVRRADGVVTEVPGRLTLLRRARGEVIGAMVVFG